MVQKVSHKKQYGSFFLWLDNMEAAIRGYLGAWIEAQRYLIKPSPKLRPGAKDRTLLNRAWLLKAVRVDAASAMRVSQGSFKGI